MSEETIAEYIKRKAMHLRSHEGDWDTNAADWKSEFMKKGEDNDE